ncbi:phage minor capsid protein [Intrasporangium flavum]|uniref:phage minor capsid protein n=1 Tax=Intrasporangium flavum TaxID=1428657 RepID=UPI00096DE0CA|nr:phage minor capsid protein [Intrasporangium flavum]
MATQPSRPADDSADLARVVDLLAAQVVAQYVSAEQDLIAEVADYARRGLAAPVGSAARLDMLRRMQIAAHRVAAELRSRATPLARRVTDEARRSGAAAALRTLTRLTGAHPSLLRTLTAPQPEPVTAHALSSVITMRLDLQRNLEDAATRVTRFGDDAYRAAVARAAESEIMHGIAPAAAQRGAWDELTSQGITGFQDSRGRRWNLASYVEMATRTAVQRAYNEAHEARMAAAGISFFTVAPHAHPCPLCRPWEGRVLSSRYPSGETTTQSALSDVMVTFEVAGTVDQARAAGLFHPNCTHTLVPYLPGVTRMPPAPDWTSADERAYRDAQRLRTFERAVRAAKQREQAALTPSDRARARADVRKAQARVRAHVAATGLLRRPRREQLDLGNG